MKNETFTPERIKAEADAFFEWDGEDRSLVTTTSCLLFAHHIAGLMKARAAQPAPVVPAECADLNHHERYRAGWNACRAAMLAAAPAQVQQVECQECERVRAGSQLLIGDLERRDATIDHLRAELSALKAQQVGQVPVGYLADDGGSMVAFFRAEEKDQFDAFCAEAEPLNKVALYTTPQPAPAQDVAGQPMQPIVFAERGVIRFKQNAIVRHLLDYASSRGCSLNELARMDFSDDDRMQLAQLIGYSVSGYGDLSYASRESVERADEIADALAAHDKQSGGDEYDPLNDRAFHQ